LWWWLAGLMFVLALAAALVFLSGLPAETLDRADKMSSVGSLITGVAALVVAGVALLLAVRQRPGSLAAGEDETSLLDRAADKLAHAVRQQWRQEADLRRLRRPQPIRVRWSTTARPVSALANRRGGARYPPDRSSPTGGADRNRREPGCRGVRSCHGKGGRRRGKSP